jgi:hypothetical protein
MSDVLGYLFLISRNYNQDYRVIYAPSFFQSPEFAGILIDATGNTVETGDHDMVTTTLDLSSSAVPSRLLYRVIPAKGYDIGDDSAGEITDNVGRTIYHIEGIIINKNIKLLASSIDGDSFTNLVHGPLMMHYSEFWHHIPKRGITEPDLAVPLSSLIKNNEIIEPEDKQKDECNPDYSTHTKQSNVKSFSRTFKHIIGLVSIVAASALLLPFTLDRKKNVLDAKITEIFYRKYNIASINTKFRDLDKLTMKYHYKSRGGKHLNCIALNRIMKNRAYEGNLKLFFTNTEGIEPKISNIGLDPDKLQGDSESCEERMRNPSFAVMQYFEFLRY